MTSGEQSSMSTSSLYMHVPPHMNTEIQTCTYTHEYTHMHKHILEHKHTHEYTPTHKHTLEHTYTRTHTHMSAHIHTHKCKNKYQAQNFYSHCLFVCLICLFVYSFIDFCESKSTDLHKHHTSSYHHRSQDKPCQIWGTYSYVGLPQSKPLHFFT